MSVLFSSSLPSLPDEAAMQLVAQRSSVVHLIKLKHLKATAMNVCKIKIIEFLQVCKQMTNYTDIPRLFINIGREKDVLT